jgi:hypothetical protein
VCQAERTDELDQLPHSFEEHTEKYPTCTETGLLVRTCSVCGYFERETIPAKGHSWNEGEQVKAPTCGDPGTTKYTCTACNATKIENDIPATGEHANTVRVGAREATETNDGYTGDVYCIDCGHLIEQGQVIPATGGGGGEEPGGEG